MEVFTILLPACHTVLSKATIQSLTEYIHGSRHNNNSTLQCMVTTPQTTASYISYRNLPKEKKTLFSLIYYRTISLDWIQLHRCSSIASSSLYAVHLVWQMWGQMHKNLFGFMTTPLCMHKEKYAYIRISVRFMKMHVHLLLFYKSQSPWKWEHMD